MAQFPPARATDADLRPAIDPQEARTLLRACFAQYRAKLLEMVRGSLELTNDLFESQSEIPDGEIESFRSKRSEWLERFDKTLSELFERRIAGQRRKGRRPDADASLATLRVLTAFDHDRQAALKAATQFLERFTQREVVALDLRVDALLPGASPWDFDNPFAVPYIVDALGASARAVYPNPRVWRPFMDRVLADLTPGVNKLCISLNRFLADRGILPEIKAALRARSEFRPLDDRDLIPTFSKMLHDAKPLVPTDIVVPEALADSNAPPALVFAEKAAARDGALAAEMSATKILAGLAALAATGARVAAIGGGTAPPLPGGLPLGAPEAPATPDAPPAFPDLDPLMALGTSTPLFATLAHWQRLDLPTAIARAAPPPVAGTVEGTVVPRNLIPHIRAAIDDQITNDTDRVTIEVIALLFDYIFRDGSIEDSLRNLFGRLQVPIVKAALLDRTFFSNKKHAARQLLDMLADAAAGATHDDAYRNAFTAVATEVIGDICRDFEIDVTVFRAANVKLAAFIEDERRRTSATLNDDMAAALDAEEREADRSHVRAFLRDRLAGVDVPFDVRSFVETVWADHLTAARQQGGTGGEAWQGAVRTLDDMLWSIVAKERTAQKARLTKMIPQLIGTLRRGCTALATAPERTRAFFEALYELHIAAIKPKAASAEPAALAADSQAAGASLSFSAAGAPTAGAAPAARMPVGNVHDFVSEMAVGTWLAFTKEGQRVNARLSWVSPLRTKYLFTSRARSRAFLYTPEELAYEVGAGQVALVVEPVPLFDRAVSAALDSLAARQPAKAA